MSDSPGPDTTARALLRAGMALFGELGFKATTTRMVADRAGANIGSIAYYYGNKRGLYCAIAAHISERLNERLALEAYPRYVADAVEAERALAGLLSRMVRLFAADDEARDWLMLVIREQVQPSEAFDILYDNAFSRVQARMSGWMACMMGRAATDPRVVLEVHALVGQVVFLLVGRTPLLRRLGQCGRLDDETVVLAESVVLSRLSIYRR